MRIRHAWCDICHSACQRPVFCSCCRVFAQFGVRGWASDLDGDGYQEWRNPNATGHIVRTDHLPGFGLPDDLQIEQWCIECRRGCDWRDEWSPAKCDCCTEVEGPEDYLKVRYSGSVQSVRTSESPHRAGRVAKRK